VFSFPVVRLVLSELEEEGVCASPLVLADAFAPGDVFGGNWNRAFFFHRNRTQLRSK